MRFIKDRLTRFVNYQNRTDVPSDDYEMQVITFEDSSCDLLSSIKTQLAASLTDSTDPPNTARALIGSHSLSWLMCLMQLL